MIRGTTSPFYFEVPYPYDTISYMRVVFWQNNNTGTIEGPLPVIKEYDKRFNGSIVNDGFTNGNKENIVCVSLSPEETLRFTDKRKGICQLNVLYPNNITVSSKQVFFTVYPAYNNEIISDIGQVLDTDKDLWVLDAGEIAANYGSDKNIIVLGADEIMQS